MGLNHCWVWGAFWSIDQCEENLSVLFGFMSSKWTSAISIHLVGSYSFGCLLVPNYQDNFIPQYFQNPGIIPYLTKHIPIIRLLHPPRKADPRNIRIRNQEDSCWKLGRDGGYFISGGICLLSSGSEKQSDLQMATCIRYQNIPLPSATYLERVCVESSKTIIFSWDCPKIGYFHYVHHCSEWLCFYV